MDMDETEAAAAAAAAEDPQEDTEIADNNNANTNNIDDDDDDDDAGKAATATEATETTEGGPVSLRPVFLGNLTIGFKTEDIVEIFSRPMVQATTTDNDDTSFHPVAVDRVDLKRGYCFVFLKDVPSMTEKESVERFVAQLNGMYVTTTTAVTQRRRRRSRLSCRLLS